MIVLGWIVACIAFVVWSSGHLDTVLRYIKRKARDLVYWVKGAT
jgi:hypothetical protein